MAMASLCVATALLLLMLSSLLALPLAKAHPATLSPAAPLVRKVGQAGLSAGLASTLCETLEGIRGVASTISVFPIGGILDGDDLLLSSDELSSCPPVLLLLLIAIELQPRRSWRAGGRLGTGDARSDLRSWLSGALGNQDTCNEDLDEIGSPLTVGLDVVTSHLADGLSLVTAAATVVTSPSSCRGLGAAYMRCMVLPNCIKAVVRKTARTKLC